MDLIITSTIPKLRWLPSLMAFFMFTASHAFETKRFDAPPPKRSSYLSFASPKKLRFAPAPIVADRGALIMPVTITPAEGGNSIESNATLEESEFPVVDYADSPLLAKLTSPIRANLKSLKSHLRSSCPWQIHLLGEVRIP